MNKEDLAIKEFADTMKRELDKNRHKYCPIMRPHQDGREWGGFSVDWLLFRLKQEVMELEDAWQNNLTVDEIMNETADVGNFAMMIHSIVLRQKEGNVPLKKAYIKPEYKLETQMTFMFDAIKNKQSKAGCRECSSCHGCRS